MASAFSRASVSTSAAIFASSVSGAALASGGRRPGFRARWPHPRGGGRWCPSLHRSRRLLPCFDPGYQGLGTEKSSQRRGHPRTPSPAHCSLMPASRMTLRQRSVSCRRNTAGFLRRAADRRGAEPVQPLGCVGHPQGFSHGFRQLRSDGRRCFRRGHDAEPARGEKFRKKLRHGRHVRKLRDARRRADRERLELAVLDVMQGVRRIVAHQLDMAGKEIGHRRRGAPVRHVREPDAGERLEPFDRKLLRATDRRACQN